MARLPPVLGRFAKAKMAISWSKWFQTRPYGMSQNSDVWEMARLNCRP